MQESIDLNNKLAGPNNKDQYQSSTIIDFLLGVKENRESDDFAKYVAEAYIDQNMHLCIWWKT